MMAARPPVVRAAATAPFVNGKIHDPRREEAAVGRRAAQARRFSGVLSGKNIKTCKINFVYKTKLAGNRLSTPFFIDSKYSSGRESGPTAETSSHLTVSSRGESANHRFRC